MAMSANFPGGMGFGLRSAIRRPAAGGDATFASSVTRHGVTFTFDQAYQVGQYCTGDWWVSGGGGNVTITSITPASASNQSGTDGDGNAYSGRTINGAVVFTGFGDADQGYDGPDGGGNPATLYNNGASTLLAYDDTENVDPGRTSSSIVLSEGTVVKAVSDLTPPGTGRASITDLVPLTVVTSAPSSNAFRPGIVASSKASSWSSDDLDMTIFPDNAAPASTPSYATLLGYVDRMISIPINDALSSRNIHPSNHHPEYGRDIGQNLSAAMLGLCTDAFTETQKKTILIGLVQLGLDVYSMLSEGVTFQDNGGGNPFRKPALVLAATALDDATLKAEANKTSVHSTDRQIFTVSTSELSVTPTFDDAVSLGSGGTGYSVSDVLTVSGGEADQAAQITVDSVDGSGTITGFTVSTNGIYISAPSLPASLSGGGGSGATLNWRVREKYLRHMINTAEWGEKHTSQSVRDGSNWDAFYRIIVVSAYFGQILACRLIDGAQAVYNNSTVFEYFDRVWNYEGGGTFGGTNEIPQFAADMYNSFRANTDTTGPVFSAAENNLDGDEIYVRFDETLDINNAVPATTDFTVEVNSVGVTINSVEKWGRGVRLKLASTHAAGDTITVAYTSGTNKLRDIWENNAASFSAQSVTNNIVATIGNFVDTNGTASYKHSITGGLGQVDGDQATFSLRWDFTGTTDGQIYVLYEAQSRFTFSRTSANKLRMTGGGVDVLSTDTVTASDGKVHILFALNRTGGVGEIYINGTEVSYDTQTIGTGSIEWTRATGVLSNASGGANADGKFSDVWWDDNYWAPGTYLTSFYDAGSGGAQDLGRDGSTPTGSAPVIFLGGSMQADQREGNTSEGWNDGYNAGTGGNFDSVVTGFTDV